MLGERVGLITYGLGPYQQCNAQLSMEPIPNAAAAIMREVNGLMPAGKTALASAVTRAAEFLDYREKPEVVILLTDGRGNMRRIAL